MGVIKNGEAWFHNYSEDEAKAESYRCYSEGDIPGVRYEADGSPGGFAVVVPEVGADTAKRVLGY